MIEVALSLKMRPNITNFALKKDLGIGVMIHSTFKMFYYTNSEAWWWFIHDLDKCAHT
jgi:hypothetical protein